MGIFDRLFGKRKEAPPPSPPPTPPPPPPQPPRVTPPPPVAETPKPTPPPVAPPRAPEPPVRPVDSAPLTAPTAPAGPLSLPSTYVAPPTTADLEPSVSSPPVPVTGPIITQEDLPQPPIQVRKSEPEPEPQPEPQPKPVSFFSEPLPPAPVVESKPAFPDDAALEAELFAEFGELTEEERLILLELKREEARKANQGTPAQPVSVAPPIAAPVQTPEPESPGFVPGSLTTELDRALVSLLGDMETSSEPTGELPAISDVAPTLVMDGAFVAEALHAEPVTGAESTAEFFGGAVETTAGPGLVTDEEVTAPATGSFFDDELGDFDDAFDSLMAGEAPAHADGESTGVEVDQGEIRELFANIAANYIKPVKNFIFELRSGAARKEWLDICQPALMSLSKSANGMGLLEVSDAVGNFDALLIEARASFEPSITGDLRERVLAYYETLVEMLPQTFTLGEESAQSEGMIINSLLKQIPDVGKVTIDKLYRAGLTTLESYFMGSKEDIAVASGLPIWLAERICEKFRQYQHDLETSPVDAGNSAHRARLEHLTQDLKEFHDQYEKATAAEWTNPAAAEDRRYYRQARQDTQLQINIVLAELQAIDLVKEIQRLSFEKRIQRLQEFLQALANEM